MGDPPPLLPAVTRVVRFYPGGRGDQVSDNPSSPPQVPSDPDEWELSSDAEFWQQSRQILASKAIQSLIVISFAAFALGLAGAVLVRSGHPRLGNNISQTAMVFIAIFIIGGVGIALAGKDAFFEGSLARGASKEYWWVVVFGVGGTVLFLLIPSGLAFLVTNGTSSAFWISLRWFAGSGGSIFVIEAILTVIIPVFLVVFPALLHRSQRWRNAASPKKELKEVVYAWLAVVASCATGLYGFMLHFIHGAAQNIPPGQLSVAILFAVLVLIPIYRSLVRAWSERGVVEVCDLAGFWNNQKNAARMLGESRFLPHEVPDTSGGQDISPRSSRVDEASKAAGEDCPG